MSSTSGSAAKSRVEELAQEIRMFLGLDDLDFSCEERMAIELVEVLKDIPSGEEQDQLLSHFVTEAWKAYGVSLPSVWEDINTAKSIAREWLDKPELLAEFIRSQDIASHHKDEEW